LLIGLGGNALIFARNKEQLHLNTEIELAKIEQQRRLVDAAQSQDLLYMQSLQIIDYIKSDQPPKIDLKTMQLRAERMLVYDRHQQCIGLIEDGKFKFYKFYAGVCQS